MSELNIIFKPFSELLSNVVDNRGKTCPTAPSGLALIATNCIKNDNLYPVYENVRYVSDETYKSWFRGHPLPGDLILVTKGTPGCVCLVPSKVDFCIAQDMVAIRADNKKVNPKYLFAALRSAGIQSEIENLHVGSLIPHFKKGDFDKLQIPLPERELQGYIGEQYFAFSAKIDLLHRQNKTLEGMAEALWRQMFVEEADPGWKKGRLGDVVEETIGGDWGEDIQSNDLIPVICLRGVDLHHIKERGLSSEAPIRFIKPTSLEKRKLNENEILIAGSGIGPIGKSIPINSALLKCYSYPVIYSNFCKRLRAESKEMAYFIEFMIYQFYKEGELDQFHMGTSVPNFNLKDFLKYEITIPPIDSISFFSSLLTDWYTKKFTNQIRTLSRLRDTLLPKLMSGEMRVKL